MITAVQQGVSRISLQAHNERREDPTANEQFNLARRLGDRRERLLLERIAAERYGYGCGRHPLTRREVDAWLRTHG
jgi:hypothetical protein